MNRYIRICFLGIVLIATFSRFYRLDEIPPSLSWDEVSIGYDAFSIAETGRDQWGEFLPISFKSFGEYKYPYHIYFTSLLVKLFGTSDFLVRFGSAFFGVINVLLLYHLVKLASGKEPLAIVSAFFLAISPWHIQFSRVSWETNYALLFCLTGLIFFVKFIRENREKFLLSSFLAFTLGLFTYNASKIFIPLVLFLLIFIHFSQVRKSRYGFLLSIAFLTTLFFSFTNSKLSGLKRLDQLRIEPDRIVQTQVYKYTKSYKLAHLEIYAEQYLSHFSYNFLFETGDPNPRHSSQKVGQLLRYDLVFIPLGIITLLKRRDKFSYLFLGLFFLAIVPASIAREVPHASRAMFTLGTWQVVSATGFIFIFNSISKKYKKVFIGLALVIIFATFAPYVKFYFGAYPVKYSQFWQYGYKEVAEFIADNYNSYDKIVMTRKYGEPQIFMLYYLKYPPVNYQLDPNLKRESRGEWAYVSGFDKFSFFEDDQMTNHFQKSRSTGEKILYISGPESVPADSKIIKKIYFLDGEIAFVILE